MTGNLFQVLSIVVLIAVAVSVDTVLKTSLHENRKRRLNTVKTV